MASHRKVLKRMFPVPRHILIGLCGHKCQDLHSNASQNALLNSAQSVARNGFNLVTATTAFVSSQIEQINPLEAKSV
jgi:hypothetical protein